MKVVEYTISHYIQIKIYKYRILNCFSSIRKQGFQVKHWLEVIFLSSDGQMYLIRSNYTNNKYKDLNSKSSKEKVMKF